MDCTGREPPVWPKVSPAHLTPSTMQAPAVDVRTAAPVPAPFVDGRTFAPVSVFWADAISARRLWFAAKCGAAIAPSPTARRIPAVYLTCNGAFLTLAHARQWVSRYGGDARKVFCLCTDGCILRTRLR